MVSLSIVLKLKANLKWTSFSSGPPCNPICSFMFTKASFRSRTRQIFDAAGSNFSQKRLPAHALPFKFDGSWSVQNASQKDWCSVENLSINCPFFTTKWLRMYLLNREFKTQIHVNCLAKIYATNLAELTFLNLICRLLRLGKRSEDASEMASSSTQLFEASCASKRKFFIIFGILPLSLPNVPLNWLEQTEYDF